MIADYSAEIKKKILILQSVSERQRAKWTIIVKFQSSCGRFSFFALLNSEVTAPIFTKISHDVEASM